MATVIAFDPARRVPPRRPFPEPRSAKRTLSLWRRATDADRSDMLELLACLQDGVTNGWIVGLSVATMESDGADRHCIVGRAAADPISAHHSVAQMAEKLLWSE